MANKLLVIFAIIVIASHTEILNEHTVNHIFQYPNGEAVHPVIKNFEDFQKIQNYCLDGRKGSFFWGKGLCKGHEKRCKGHVQGPQIWQIELGARATWICARATRRGARASDVCKGHTNDTQYNLVQGPQLEVQGNLKF